MQKIRNFEFIKDKKKDIKISETLFINLPKESTTLLSLRKRSMLKDYSD